MPVLQPAHESYVPAYPSRLGLYSYVAADIEQHEEEEGEEADGKDAPEADTGQAEFATTGAVDSGVSNSPADYPQATNGSGGDDDVEESPRKRRRLQTDKEDAGGFQESLTVEHALPAALDAGWSFRPLDEEAGNQAVSLTGTEQRPDVAGNIAAEDVEGEVRNASVTLIAGPARPDAGSTPESRRIRTGPFPEASRQQRSVISDHTRATGTSTSELSLSESPRYLNDEQPRTIQEAIVPERGDEQDWWIQPRTDSPDEVSARASAAGEGTLRLGRRFRSGT